MHKKQQNRQRDILFILISSFIVVVAWISFNIYHIWVTSTVPNTISPQLEPINPQFDATVRQQLKSREQVDPLYDKQSSGKQTSAAPTDTTPTPSPLLPQASESAQQTIQTGSQPSGLQGQ